MKRIFGAMLDIVLRRGPFVQLSDKQQNNMFFLARVLFASLLGEACLIAKYKELAFSTFNEWNISFLVALILYWVGCELVNYRGKYKNYGKFF